jgi:predicted nucleic acid-binding protein
VIVDTSALLALFDRSDPNHERVVEALGESSAPLVVSPYVLAELDYLVLSRHGSQAEECVVEELAGGGWELEAMSPARVIQALAVVRRFRDQRIGLTDASVMVLAQEYRTREVLTLDRRHFSVLRFADGSAPEIMPAC